MKLGRTREFGAFLALAMLSGCNNVDHAGAAASKDSVTLANGVVLPILPGVKLQPQCELVGYDVTQMTQTKDVICLEYPGSMAEEPNGGIQNRYTKLLLDRGFKFEGGAAIEYWFSWPMRDGCSRRFNIASIPKIMPSGDDWSKVETFVLAMSFGSKSCEKER